MHRAWPRGTTPRPRSGAEARRTPCPKGSGQEELPHVRGQGQRRECQAATVQEWPRGATLRLRSGATAEGSYPVSEVRGGGQECQAATVQEQPRGATPLPRSGAAARRSYPPSKARGNSWEELPHTRGQGWWPRPGTPCPRSGGCKGAGGPRGAISRSKSGGVAVKRYPSFNIRSSSCALLEQP